MALSDDQVKQIASNLFLMQPAANTKLTKPVNSVVGSLAAKLDPIAKEAPFVGWGIGVADFTASASGPSIWLNDKAKSDRPWRMGSTGKIAILLAAAQLRDDVQAVQDTKLLSKPEDYDELFASARLWKLATDPKARSIAGKDRAPRISTIFDFSKTPVDFTGSAPGTADFSTILERLALSVGKPKNKAHLSWPFAIDYDFSERLWLTGAMSDNIAATCCISEIGVDYLRAVQRAYGLFDPSNGMHLFLNGGYKELDTKALVSNNSTATYRRLQDAEKQSVTDALFSGATRDFTDDQSSQPGSAAALLAYMIGLVRNDLVGLRHGFAFGQVGCDAIRTYLSHGAPDTQSFIARGAALEAEVTLQITKIGLLGREDGEPGPLNCEFAYLETKQRDASAKVMKYGVVVTGIRATDRAGPNAATLTRTLGSEIHRALAGP